MLGEVAFPQGKALAGILPVQNAQGIFGGSPKVRASQWLSTKPRRRWWQFWRAA